MISFGLRCPIAASALYQTALRAVNGQRFRADQDGSQGRDYTQTARTGRSNQVASLWAAMPKSTKNHAKSGLGAKLKSSKTNNSGCQNKVLKPESGPAWLETPWV